MPCGWVYGEKEKDFPACLTSFAEAAGVAGRQKWGQVLFSSARVSQVTSNSGWGEVSGVGHSTFPMRDRNEGPSSLFFGIKRANTHAVEDIGAVVDWFTERWNCSRAFLALLIWC